MASIDEAHRYIEQPNFEGTTERQALIGIAKSLLAIADALQPIELEAEKVEGNE